MKVINLELEKARKEIVSLKNAILLNTTGKAFIAGSILAFAENQAFKK